MKRGSEVDAANLDLVRSSILPQRRSRSLRQRGLYAWHLYLFIAPTFVLILVFQYYPALSAIFHAFTDWNGAGAWEWTGLQNFQFMTQDFALISSVKNLAILLTWQVIRALTIPLIFAELVLNFPNARAQYWFRLLLITPLVIPVVVESLVWRFILGPAPLGCCR